MRIFMVPGICAALAVAACAPLEWAQIAEDARSQMLGLSKEQVLACMGPPANRMAEGATEVWAYRSGNGQIDVASSASVAGPMVTGDTVATMRFCNVQVVMQGGRVTRLNYTGPTGGFLAPGEQCAFAVRNCVRPSAPSSR